jgi:type III secretion system FlhB-like substrate exporter
MHRTAETECWADAIAVEYQYGARAPEFIAERVGALAAKGDVAGVERWKQIAFRFDTPRATRSIH